jgi:hypothetical protein
MQFNSLVFCRKKKCFRSSWKDGHFLTYDGENFIEHVGEKSRVWFWESAEQARQDLTAADWRYID